MKAEELENFYDLYLYLNKQSDDPLKLSYEEIEQLLNGKLPNSAYQEIDWWENDEKQLQAKAWMEANYKVDKIQLREYIIFVRRVRYYNCNSKFVDGF